MEADGESWLNSADVWDQALGDGQWPGAQARVDLHYPALAAPVTVPSHVREAFGPFLPTLLDDLART
jgi:hypothetical protein